MQSKDVDGKIWQTQSVQIEGLIGKTIHVHVSMQVSPALPDLRARECISNVILVLARQGDIMAIRES